MKNAVIACIDGYDSLLARYGRVIMLNDDSTVPLIGNCGKMDYSLNPDYAVLSVPEPILGKVYYYNIRDWCCNIMIEGYSIWDGEKFVPAHGLFIPPAYDIYNYFIRRSDKNNEE